MAWVEDGRRNHEIVGAGLNNTGISRRDFVQSIAAAGIAVGIGSESWAAETKADNMIYRTLGRTGQKVSAIGLGGFHIGVQAEEQESIRLVCTAIDNGINFLDNCWDYN